MLLMLKSETAEYSTGYAIYNACFNILVSITCGLWIADWVQNEPIGQICTNNMDGESGSSQDDRRPWMAIQS